MRSKTLESLIKKMPREIKEWPTVFLYEKERFTVLNFVSGAGISKRNKSIDFFIIKGPLWPKTFGSQVKKSTRQIFMQEKNGANDFP